MAIKFAPSVPQFKSKEPLRTDYFSPEPDKVVPKAVPIYASNQSDDLWLAPQTGRVGRSAFGP